MPKKKKDVSESPIFKAASPQEIANRPSSSIDAPIYPSKTLQELAEVVSGVEVSSKQIFDSGIWHLIRKNNIVKGTVSPSNIFVPADFVKKHPEGIIAPGDVLISPYFGKYKVGVVPSNFGPSLIDSGIIRIRPFGETQKYLTAFLSTRSGKSTLLEQILKSAWGSAVKSPVLKYIKELTIPILPSDVLKTLEVDISQKNTLAELESAHSVYEKEILRVVKFMLLQKGWSEGDIESESRISKSFKTDILLRRKGKPVALVEIKKDARNEHTIIQRIRSMCKVANIRSGYLIDDSGITEISCFEDKLKKRKDFPSPEELK